MENVSLILYIAIAVPLSGVLIFCERRSRTTLFFLLIGMTVCLFCGEVNTLLYRALPLPEELFITNISPITEEVCKALPVLAYAFLYFPPRKDLLVCSFALGVGFAVLENAAVISSGESISLWLALIRGFGCGISHGLCTMAVGYGCSYIYKRRKLFYTGTFALLAFSIILHAVHNLLSVGGYDIAATVLAVALLILFRLMAGKRSHEKTDRDINNGESKDEE